MPRSVPALVLSEDQRRQLDQWLAALGTPQQVALRCRIVLGVAVGRSEAAVARGRAFQTIQSAFPRQGFALVSRSFALLAGTVLFPGQDSQ